MADVQDGQREELAGDMCADPLRLVDKGRARQAGGAAVGTRA
jgi:hypothetical protein